MLRTLLLLLDEFSTLHPKAEAVAEKYLGINKRECQWRASKGELPFPTFRAETRKSPLLCDLRDVAEWIDRVRLENKKDWEKLHEPSNGTVEAERTSAAGLHAMLSDGVRKQDRQRRTYLPKYLVRSLDRD